MADLSHVTENALREKSWSVTPWGGLVMLVISLIFASLMHSPLPLLFGFLALVADYFQQGDAYRAGARGEERTLDMLGLLPDDWTVFNQVHIPHPRQPGRSVEADLLVVGPRAVFVIEVKHNRGHISGASEDRDWSVTKVGRKGGTYTKTMRNPVRQVQTQVWALSEALRARGVRTWVEGVVAFSHPEARLRLYDTPKVPVLKAEEVPAHLLDFVPKRPLRDRAAVVAALSVLIATPTPA